MKWKVYFFTQYDVDSSTALNLIRRYNNCELIDSINVSYNGEIKTEVVHDDFKTITKQVYLDGSIKVSSIPKSNPLNSNVNLFSVSGGSYTIGGTWWKWDNVKVEETVVFATASFRMNCSGSTYSYDAISSAYDAYITVIGGSFSNVELKIIRKTATINAPAEARLTFYAKYPIYSQTNWVQGFSKNGNVYSGKQ